jgi:DNA polymerase III subunit epsilon
MNLDNIVWLDVETTGVVIGEDRVIELGMVCIKDGERKSWTKRFKVDIPIKPEATEVHGITDADLAEEKPFSAYAPHIHRALNGKHLGGYNLRRLDLPLIDDELRRCGLKLDLTGAFCFDAAAIFFKREPRGLEDAVRKYCGREHEGKHGAAADAEATLDVFMGQLTVYPDLAELSLDKLAEYARMNEGKDADLAGKLAYSADGKLCYAFGKHRGKPVLDEPGYAMWMLNATNPGFPGSTCEMLEAELHKNDIAVSETSNIDDANVPF